MEDRAGAGKPLGFWSCWALAVGTMIGSGVFSLPTVLAQYGLLSFGGWIVSAGGAIALALVFARLSAHTATTGGPYVYAREAFGDLIGFLVAWSLWASYVIATPAVAIAFAGYLGGLAPAAFGAPTAQAAAALLLMGVLTAINVRGLREAGVAQLVMTFLKIAPLLAVSAYGFIAGRAENLPEVNPTGGPFLPTIAATALLTLWAFTGFEAGAVPAGSVAEPQRTIPRALIIGMLTVASIYLVATFAVMRLVPASVLGRSTAPFIEAARGMGAIGPLLVGAGALVSTAGSANGILFVCGQTPMAAARDGLAPSIFARVGRGGAPTAALLLSAALGAALLLVNYSRGAVGAFTFLLTMSTLSNLVVYFVCALADFKQTMRLRSAALAIAIVGAGYALFAIVGSGAKAIALNAVLLACGVPLYFLFRMTGAARARVREDVR